MSGNFTLDTKLEGELDLIRLNVIAPVQFAKLVIRDMVRQGDGKVLFTSSIAGTMQAPFFAVYGASKAFLTSFGQAIRNELKDSGVSVTVLMPGATETEFFQRAHMEDSKIGASENKDDPADVARDGFEALMAGKVHVVAGSFKNKIQAAGHVLPDPVMAGLHRKQSEPGTADTESQ